MTDELKKQLSDLLATGIDFAKQELPQIAREYLTYGFYSSIFWIVVSVIMIILAIVLFRKTRNLDGELYMFGLIGSISILILSTGTLIINTLDAVKIKVAPRVYIIDSLRPRSK